MAGAYNSRGVAYINQGQYNQAIADYNKTIELDPNYALAYKNRGLVHTTSGNLEQAIRDFERYLELVPNAPDREAILITIEALKAKLGQ